MNAYTSMEISTFTKKKTFNEDQTLNNNSYINSIIDMYDLKIQGKSYIVENEKINKLYPDLITFINEDISSQNSSIIKKVSLKNSINSNNNSELKVIKIAKKELSNHNSSNDNKNPSNNTIKLNKDNFQIGINIRFHSPMTAQKVKHTTTKNSPVHNTHKSPPNNKIYVSNKNTLKQSPKLTNKNVDVKSIPKIYNKAFSPKPSSPTEMHNEMKSNGCYIKKNVKNQSLALNSTHRNIITCESPSSDKANESINNKLSIGSNNKNNGNMLFAKKIKTVGINKKVRKNISPPQIPKTINNTIKNTNGNKMRFKRDEQKLNLSFDEIIYRQKVIKKQKKNNNIRKNKLNKSYDNLKIENSVFEDDDIFKVLDNTQIIIPKNNLETFNPKGKKLEIIRENSENDLIPRGEDGERITANFMKNGSNDNNYNNQVLFDRFSFHNHNLP